ncbi:oxidoreductase [Sphingobium lactosutens]|uniref:ArnT family glycosyltransferase n=1 Tax=Sphingobium lactosutens TaxID=522773 RepID=UPI0015BF5EDE|nr:glycosyltransferase family 39 protein [Sphingobium lactosutens]NWK98188.1 oxidoreductase [Sphingobium lactosutens]
MKTVSDRASRPEKGGKSRRVETGVLIGILALSAALRLWHLNFGLPALNDPDEPLFVMTALDMVREHRLNPEWFGHPATMLLYALAAIFAFVGWAGTLSGQWPDAAGYVSAVYADPSIAILPMRLFIAATGVGCVYLTYRIGRDHVSPRSGLIAAALLACNGLHVELSQVIRTDMLASLFMLWSSRYAVRAAGSGSLRDHVLAGVMLGLGGATKWPALLFVVNGAGAVGHRWRQAGWKRSLRSLPLLPVVAVATLCLVSPYLLLDHGTVLRDLGGEARPTHLGATGGSAGDNLLWYARHILVDGFGWFGTVLAAIGMATICLRYRALALAGFAGASLFLIGIAAQFLVWERWAVPLLPWIALAIAVALDRLATLSGSGGWRRWMPVAALAALLVPMGYAAISRSIVRAHDTRQQASQWVRDHVAGDQSILIEDAAFDLLDRPGPVIFPLGDAGCIDVHQMLKAGPSYRQVGEKRSGKAIVDLGNVAPALLDGCRARIAIITHYDRYRLEAARFPRQLDQYDRLMRGAQSLAIFRPRPGRVGGPVTRVIRLDAPAP